MKLTKKEQEMFDGEHGEAVRQSMEILVALGKIYSAECMIPVSSAQIAGVSYKTIGDAGLEYLQGMVKRGAMARIPAFLNPAGMDVEQWKNLGVPEDFAIKQIEVLEAYQRMGIQSTCTCTPYLIGITPKLREFVAWSESSAVSYANSVLGARTNREGGPSALAAAICGVTPYYGLHLDENRISDIQFNVECKIEKQSDFGALGAFAGEIAKNKHPAFVGLDKKRAGIDRLKALGASMAANGSVALFYAKGITPEFVVSDKPEKVVVGEKELKEAKEKLTSAESSSNGKPNIVAIGCPHASLEEIKNVVDVIERKKIKKLKCELWVCTARVTKKKAEEAGYVKIIEATGGKVVADTCMVVCPLEMMGFTVTGCNSGKAAKYLPGFCKQKVVFGDLEELIC